MAPRQLVRLKESRRPDSYDDQKSPAEIQQAEVVSADLEDLVHYVLSQLRQITGEANWFDPVQQSLKEILETRNTFPAECLATDAVGDCVYARQSAVGGVYQVTKVDPHDEATMPAVGIILSKTSDTDCVVQVAGLVEGVYGGMDIRKALYVDEDGGLTQVLPALVPGDRMFVQGMGMAVDEDALVLSPSASFARRRG